MFRSEYKLDKLIGSGGGGLYLFLVLLLIGYKMLAWQSDRLWLSLDFLAAGDVKSISANLFRVFPVLCKDGATQYAFVSVTVIDSLLLTVNSNQDKIEAIWVQTSAKPAMQVQWAETTVPTSSAITHGFSGGSFNRWECST